MLPGTCAVQVDATGQQLSARNLLLEVVIKMNIV